MRDFLALVAVFGLVVFGINSCQSSDWYKQQEKDRIARERAEQTPHVVREADGCKVYAFKSGDRYHYFTRCPENRTATESSYTVQCGKNCTRTETETIEVTK